jgi:outer membrane protein assembly factor BamB
MLYRIAGDKAPSVTAEEGDSRKKYRDAWADWWRDAGEKLDLAKIDLKNTQLGYTLMILLDQNKIIEVDKDKKQRWELGNLQRPLDLQILPGERILIAEHDGNVVTERNRDGKVLWKKEVVGPIMAQRLANGHTFIASEQQLIEVDKDGKETFTYTRDTGEMFMKAIKLANGDIVCITNGGMCYRLNSAGKEHKTFNVNLETFGGRLDVLPNGHILVPQTPLNEVTEFDADGKAVWRAKFDRPIAAIRLSTGNTLITSMTQKRAVEVNTKGTVVWEYSTETRVTRAFRR